MPIRVSARTNAELRGTVLAIKTLDRDLRKQLRRGTKEVAGMAWGRELTRRASTTLEHRFAARRELDVRWRDRANCFAGAGFLLRAMDLHRDLSDHARAAQLVETFTATAGIDDRAKRVAGSHVAIVT